MSTATSSILGAGRRGVDGGVPVCCCLVVVCSDLCVDCGTKLLAASIFTESRAVEFRGARLCGVASTTYSVFTDMSTVLMVAVLASFLAIFLLAMIGSGMMGVSVSTIYTGVLSSSPGRSQYPDDVPRGGP